MWRNTAAKQKSCGGNIVAIHNVIFEKTTKLNSEPAQYKKNKIDKDQFEKKIHKKKEKNHIGKYCSNPQYFKEKNYIAKFLTSSIFKKIGKDNFEKKIKIKKLKKRVNFEKKRKKTCEKKKRKPKKKHVGKATVLSHAF